MGASANGGTAGGIGREAWREACARYGRQVAMPAPSPKEEEAALTSATLIPVNQP